MRHVLVDHAKRRNRRKRGGDRDAVPLDVTIHGLRDEALDDAPRLAIHEALEHLELVNPRAHDVVELSIFGGRSMPEVAETLGMSLGTVELDWRTARTWLRDRLYGETAT